MDGQRGGRAPAPPPLPIEPCEALRRLWRGDGVPRAKAWAPRNALPTLDDKAGALVSLGALVATSAGVDCFQGCVGRALAAGATPEEVVGTLLAVTRVVGLAHLQLATAGVALGLGYDVDRALEVWDPPLTRPPMPAPRSEAGRRDGAPREEEPP